MTESDAARAFVPASSRNLTDSFVFDVSTAFRTQIKVIAAVLVSNTRPLHTHSASMVGRQRLRRSVFLHSTDNTWAGTV
jgi:hypothetical protein